MDVRKIPLDKIVVDKNNPRSVVEEVDELAQSIQQHGQHEPVSVEDLGNGKFLLQNGHRRFNAKLKIQKDTKSPQTLLAIVYKSLSDEERLIKQAQIDSQTKTLSPKDRDKLWEKLYKNKKYTTAEFAKLIGVSTTSVGAFIDRLGLPEHLKKLDLSQSILNETKGLDKKTRNRVIGFAQKNDIGSRVIRDVVKNVREADPKVAGAFLGGKIDLEDMKKLKGLAPERAEVGIQAIQRMRKDIKSVPKSLDTAKLDELTRKKVMDAQQFIKRLQDEMVQTMMQMGKIEGVLEKIEADKLDEHFDAGMKTSLIRYLTEMDERTKTAMQLVERTIDRWR
jgi:ParB/RepB/Spo0J family partition protein